MPTWQRFGWRRTWAFAYVIHRPCWGLFLTSSPNSGQGPVWLFLLFPGVRSPIFKPLSSIWINFHEVDWWCLDLWPSWISHNKESTCMLVYPWVILCGCQAPTLVNSSRASVTLRGIHLSGPRLFPLFCNWVKKPRQSPGGTASSAISLTPGFVLPNLPQTPVIFKAVLTWGRFLKQNFLVFD